MLRNKKSDFELNLSMSRQFSEISRCRNIELDIFLIPAAYQPELVDHVSSLVGNIIISCDLVKAVVSQSTRRSESGRGLPCSYNTDRISCVTTVDEGLVAGRERLVFAVFSGTRIPDCMALIRVLVAAAARDNN